MDEADRVAVVVPAHNEARVVVDVLQELREYFPLVMCVDDGSTDDTSLRARQAGAVVIRHAINRGQGAALQTGFQWVLQRPEISGIVTFDADGQHRVSDALDMTRLLFAGEFDVVLGSRFLSLQQQTPLLRRAALRMATRYTRAVTGLPVTDTHNGLRVLSRRAAKCMRFRHPGMAHASEVLEIIRSAGLSWVEHPVTIDYTDHSLAKGQSMWNSVNILWDTVVKELI